jgi:DNA transformation protein and related proteins
MDADVIRDLFRDFGPVDIRRMFGGAGVFVDSLMIALIARDVIYLKADSETIPAFEAEGLDTFRYATRNGEHTLTSYWRMPERLYDEPDELARWARDAHAAALRAQTRSTAKLKKSGRKAGGQASVRRRASRSPTSRPRGRSRT